MVVVGSARERIHHDPVDGNRIVAWARPAASAFAYIVRRRAQPALVRWKRSILARPRAASPPFGRIVVVRRMRVDRLIVRPLGTEEARRALALTRIRTGALTSTMPVPGAVVRSR